MNDLKNPSIKIRKWSPSDASALAEALNNRRVLDNLRDGIPYPYTEDDARDYISAMLSSDLNDTFSFAITVDDVTVGCISAFRQNNIHNRTAEMGYYLDEKYWGRGIMTVAVSLLCDYVFTHSDIVRIYAEPFSTNIPSCRVLEKAGFTCEATLRDSAFKDNRLLDQKLYAILSPTIS